MAVSMRNKIKSLWKNFKHWLIRKLGGYIAPTQELKIEHINCPIVKYHSSTTFPAWGREIPLDVVKQDLAEDIARAILNEMNLHISENREMETKTYLAEIEIVKR